MITTATKREIERERRKRNLDAAGGGRQERRKKNLFLFVGYPADDDVSIGWSPSTTTTQRKKKLTRYLGEVPHSHPSLVWVWLRASTRAHYQL